MLSVPVKRGDLVSCNYPLHGKRNILKRHSGVVERTGYAANGPYIVLREDNGLVRTLLFSKMVQLSVSVSI